MIRSISDCISKNLDPFLQDSKNSGIDKIVNLFFILYSSKQSVRPDSIADSIRESFPALKHSLSIQFSRVVYAIKNILGISAQEQFKDDIIALEMLHNLEKSLIEKKEVQVSLDEKKILSEFFAKISSSSEYLCKLESWLTLTRQKQEVFKAFKCCKDLTKVIYEDIVDPLEKKLESISQFLNSSRTTLEDILKLKPLDYRVLFLAHSKKMLLDNLQELGVEFDQAKQLQAKWNKLEKLNEDAVVKDLRQLALNDLKSGSVFFGHRFMFSKIREEQFSTVGAIKNILIGSLNHVAIFTKGEKGIYLSHVGSQEGKHTVKPIVDPLFFAFFRLAHLDISALLPKQVSVEHTELLKGTFSEEFERLASEEHPGVTMERENPHFMTALLGHKNIYPRELSSVEVKSNQVMDCSLYVATIFLQAIQGVNKKLNELGYSEKIEHPFGRYESLDRMDPLRLYYHLKRLNIIKCG